MKLAPFKLDEWLNHYVQSNPPIEFDLGSSTGPYWTLQELLSLGGAEEHERLMRTKLKYSHARGTEKLREAIAEMQAVDPDEVQILTGASEALLILLYLAAEPGANVILPFPVYPAMSGIAESLGFEIRSYHLRRENGFRVDHDEVKGLVDKNTKLLIVNNPHNPTGSTLSDDDMRELHDLSANRGVQFVVDEVYHPIYHGRETASAAGLPQATVLGDFSKALCLSGLRTGWIVERDRERMRQYTDARSYFTICNSAIEESLAVLAVRHRQTILARALKVMSSNLKLLEKFFSENGEVMGWVRPQGGMTTLGWLQSGEDARPFCEALAKKGVLLAPGDCFEMPSYFRLGFGASGERFPQALTRLSEFVENIRSSRARAG